MRARRLHTQDVDIFRYDVDDVEYGVVVHVVVTAWPRPARWDSPAEGLDWDYTTYPLGIELTDDELADVEAQIVAEEP